MKRGLLCMVLASLAAVGCANGEEMTQVGDSGATPDLGNAMDTPTVTPVNCGAVTQCGTCASLGPCGWCGATGTCMGGNTTGPSAGACASGWTPAPDRCPVVDAGTPDTGTTTPVDSGSPVDAGTVAPDTGTTTPVDAGSAADTGTAAADAGDPCASSTTCGACTGRASCGFCGATGRCQTGGRDAPTMGPSCASGWSWLSSQCTAATTDAGTATDLCASAADCGACTARSSCGWCPGLNRCLPGTGTGPNTMAATCGSWAWYTGQCTARPDAGTAVDAGPAVDAGDPCISATTCSSCTGRSQCGWCPGANRCAVGTSSGPSGVVASCGSWAWLGSQCTTTADAGTDAGTGTDSGTQGPGIPGFGNPTSFNPADVARACPAGGTLRLQVTRIYATPRRPDGNGWDGIPGLTDFVCNASADRVREVLRDQINGVRMDVGDAADRVVGDAFRNVVATQCGAGANWFLGRWEGPDMFALMYSPGTAVSPRWTTSTENDSWEAPRVGAVWSNAFVEIPCAALGTSTFRLEVRDEELFSLWERMGETTFRGSEVSPRAMCSGIAFHEGFGGVAGVLFSTSVTGATQNCTGLR
ncbi:MAG: hypothetical protein EPO40_07365 [Myxococcaceae bacterium]|nr:MAG: hypothetical protein EPO40_07365 [Myxococcaceae bacterium]